MIQSRPGALTDEQVRAAVARLQPLKVSPRDLLPNRARIERAHRRFAELTGVPRRLVAEALDEFEAALSTGDRDAIGLGAARLDAVLARAYDDEGERAGPAGKPS